MFFGAMIDKNLVQPFYLLVATIMIVSIFWSLHYKVRTKLNSV